MALTFDDGPGPETAEAVRILSNAGERATFFMLGKSVRSRGDQARQVAARDMLVGNHSATHPDLRKLSTAEMRDEILEAARLIEEETGVFPRWFRPPYGKLPKRAAGLLEELGMKAALWDVDSTDWGRPSADRIAQTVLSRVRPGSVVLLHDGEVQRGATIAALPAILEGLRELKYECVTLDEL